MASFPVELILDSPWQRLLHHIPFSRNVCVAGSVGTWFAHLALTGVLPLWSPSDIDVFVLTKSDSDFAQLVLSVAQNVFAKSDTVQSLLRVEAALAGTRKRVIDLHVEANVVLSFIQVTFDVSEDYWVEYLMRSFDINVCKVALHRRIAVVHTATEAAGETVQVVATHPNAHFEYFVEMDHCVCLNISRGQMDVEFMPTSDIWMRYIVGLRSLRRLEKYEARGFRLSKITFEFVNMRVLQFAGVFETFQRHKKKRLCDDAEELS